MPCRAHSDELESCVKGYLQEARFITAAYKREGIGSTQIVSNLGHMRVKKYNLLLRV